MSPISSLIRATTILLAGATLSYAGPLHEAILQGDLEKVQKRIALGDDVNDQDALGTPLFLALFTHNTEMARALIEAGADPNYAGGHISNVQLAVQIGDAWLAIRTLKNSSRLEE